MACTNCANYKGKEHSSIRRRRRIQSIMSFVDKVICVKSLTCKQFCRETRSVSYQLLQDIVDIIIPSGNLGWLPVDEGIIGIAG